MHHGQGTACDAVFPGMNQGKLKMAHTKTIAVIGGGATGHAAAADLTLAGHQVVLFEEARYSEHLEKVQEVGGIHLKGAGQTGMAKIHRITHDIGEALDAADLVLEAVHAKRHSEIAKMAAPFLRDEHAWMILPGNVGSLATVNVWRKMQVKAKPHIAELESSFYACRLTGPAEVTLVLPPSPKYIAALPAKNTLAVIDAFKGVYELMAAANVFEAALNSPNINTHLMGSLLNAGAIEKAEGKFILYAEGYTPAVIRCIKGLHAEKSALFEVLGYANRSIPRSLEAVADPNGPSELALLRTAYGPTSMQHRYITEDAYACASLIISLGELSGIPTPLFRAMVTLASTISSTDYLAIGRTLKNLGLDGLTPDELNTFLIEGP